MSDKIFDYVGWICGAGLLALFCWVCYVSGVHNAREQLCNKVEGVYVQTYTNGWKCVHATVVDLK